MKVAYKRFQERGTEIYYIGIAQRSDLKENYANLQTCHVQMIQDADSERQLWEGGNSGTCFIFRGL